MIHTARQLEIYLEGRNAYGRGMPLTQNPYFGHRLESHLWEGGWLDAAAPAIQVRSDAYKAVMVEREAKAAELAKLSWTLWNARVRGEQNG